jgi:hypothetical protein
MDPRLAAAGPSVFPAIRETFRSIKILLNVSSANRKTSGPTCRMRPRRSRFLPKIDAA